MLVKTPFIEVVTLPTIREEAILKFAEYKGLDVTKDGTTLKNLYDKIISRISDGDSIIEFGGRICYSAFNKGRNSEDYIEHVLEEKHGSVTSHANYGLIISGISRSCANELIRHSTGFAPSQLSQRFVDEGKTNFVVPPAISDLDSEELLFDFETDCKNALASYKSWQKNLENLPKKQKNEAARSVLPNSVETDLLFTGNIRAWRNLIEQRAKIWADREIRRLAVEITKKLKPFAPLSLNDLEVFIDEDGHESVKVEFSKV